MKTLLLIRPNLSDGFTEQSYEAAGLLLDEAKKNGWNIVELCSEYANRKEVETALKSTTTTVDFVIHYDHGEIDTMYGQSAQKTGKPQKEPVVDTYNVAILGGKAVSTVSCYTTRILGDASVKNPPGARAYLGYKNPIGFPEKNSRFHTQFVEGFNQANVELLRGKTFEDAFKIGQDTLNQKWLDIHNTIVPKKEESAKKLAEACMIYNRDSLELKGNPNYPNAHAYPP